jgi:hypothetical protein
MRDEAEEHQRSPGDCGGDAHFAAEEQPEPSNACPAIGEVDHLPEQSVSATGSEPDRCEPIERLVPIGEEKVSDA